MVRPLCWHPLCYWRAELNYLSQTTFFSGRPRGALESWTNMIKVQIRKILPQVRGIRVRRACRLAALVSLAAALALGAHPALAQTIAKEAESGPPAGQLRPLGLVSSSVSRVLAIVQSRPADATERANRQVEIRRVADGLFNFEDMARRMLAQHWSDGSPQEQKEFVRLFTDLLDRSYMTTIGNYPLATITFQGESVSGSYAQVRSRMTADNGVEVPIEYRLSETDGRWAVYDVVVNGVSLISSYRSQFNSILRRASFAQLLERMRDREARLVPQEGQ